MAPKIVMKKKQLKNKKPKTKILNVAAKKIEMNNDSNDDSDDDSLDAIEFNSE